MFTIAQKGCAERLPMTKREDSLPTYPLKDEFADQSAGTAVWVGASNRVDFLKDGYYWVWCTRTDRFFEDKVLVRGGLVDISSAVKVGESIAEVNKLKRIYIWGCHMVYRSMEIEWTPTIERF
jgi:hypothetical protein